MALGKRETYDQLEDALYHIHEAMDAMRPVEDDEGVYDALELLEMDVSKRKDELNAELYAQEQAEEDQLILDYYKEVL